MRPCHQDRNQTFPLWGSGRDLTFSDILYFLPKNSYEKISLYKYCNLLLIVPSKIEEEKRDHLWFRDPMASILSRLLGSHPLAVEGSTSTGNGLNGFKLAEAVSHKEMPAKTNAIISTQAQFKKQKYQKYSYDLEELRKQLLKWVVEALEANIAWEKLLSWAQNLGVDKLRMLGNHQLIRQFIEGKIPLKSQKLA